MMDRKRNIKWSDEESLKEDYLNKTYDHSINWRWRQTILRKLTNENATIKPTIDNNALKINDSTIAINGWSKDDVS